MKPTFLQLTPAQQATFGDGCSFVPDFIFTANCRQHDFNYSRGKCIHDKIKADHDMCSRMWSDSSKAWHYAVTIVYWLGLTFLPFPYFAFHWSRKYRTLEEIIQKDLINKL